MADQVVDLAQANEITSSQSRRAQTSEQAAVQSVVSTTLPRPVADGPQPSAAEQHNRPESPQRALFEGLAAWFGNDVPPEIISLWLRHGGRIAAYPLPDPNDLGGMPRLIFTRGEDPQIRLLHTLQTHSRYRGLNLYNPDFIKTCAEAGTLTSASLWDYIIPSPVIQETTSGALQGSRSSPLAPLPVPILPSPEVKDVQPVNEGIQFDVKQGRLRLRPQLANQATIVVTSIRKRVKRTDANGQPETVSPKLLPDGTIEPTTSEQTQPKPSALRRSQRHTQARADLSAPSTDLAASPTTSSEESKASKPEAVAQPPPGAQPVSRQRRRRRVPGMSGLAEEGARNRSLFERFVMVTHTVRNLDPELADTLARQAPSIARESQILAQRLQQQQGAAAAVTVNLSVEPPTSPGTSDVQASISRNEGQQRKPRGRPAKLSSTPPPISPTAKASTAPPRPAELRVNVPDRRSVITSESLGRPEGGTAVTSIRTRRQRLPANSSTSGLGQNVEAHREDQVVASEPKSVAFVGAARVRGAPSSPIPTLRRSKRLTLEDSEATASEAEEFERSPLRFQRRQQ